MLVTLKELLDEAKVEHKAVGAFNGTTLEAIRGIIQAAEELNSPVILQHAQSHDDLIDLEEIGPVMKYYAERAKVPVALHLDHGSSFDRCVQALKLGFTSVMYDASAKSFEENAAETAEIVKLHMQLEQVLKLNWDIFSHQKSYRVKEQELIALMIMKT